MVLSVVSAFESCPCCNVMCTVHEEHWAVGITHFAACEEVQAVCGLLCVTSLSTE